VVLVEHSHVKNPMANIIHKKRWEKPIEISKPEVTHGWGQHSPILIQQSVLLDASLLSEMQLKVEIFGCKDDVEP